MYYFASNIANIKKLFYLQKSKIYLRIQIYNRREA